MSILEILQQASTDAGFRGMSFANLQEFNAFNDSFKFQEYPRNVIVPYNTNIQLLSNRKKKVIILQGWGITRIDQDTNDWRSLQLEEKYIVPMRERVEKFLNQIANSDISDPEVESLSATIRPEYMWLKDHLFGVSYTINWPVLGNIC